MNAYTELAKLFNERNNNKQYGPVIGNIISLRPVFPVIDSFS